MEKNSTEILQEIEAALASLKERVQALETQVEAYRQAAAEEAEAAALTAPDAVPEPAPEPQAAEVDFDMVIGEDELPDEPAEPAEDLPAAAPEGQPAEEPVEMVVEDLPEPAAAAEPAPEPAPEPVPDEKPAPAAVPRVDTERMAWRLDKPGVSVKNIRSGISLYDRALFIGTLFKEDYALYDKTIGDLNALSTLDEAVDYLVEAFPDWNLKSDIVYNFMMAIRKKLG